MRVCKEGPGLPANAGQAERLVIGLLVPGTGDQSAAGLDYLNAANLAAKCLNDAGGANSAPVVILTGDTMGLSEPAVQEAGRLIDEGAVTIVGAASTEISLDVAEAVAVPRGVFQISPIEIASSEVMFEDNDLFFSMPAAVDGDARDSFDEAFLVEYGAMYTSDAVRQVFDAVIVIGLAAQAAETNTDSAAIRDNLRAVANTPGTEYGPGEADISAAILDLATGEQVDYQGATGSVDFE